MTDFTFGVVVLGNRYNTRGDLKPLVKRIRI